MEEGIAAIFLGMLLVLVLILIAVKILIIIGKWKVLEKAGEDGWKALIPVYGNMVLCKSVGVWEWYPLVVLAVGMFSSLMGDNSYISGTVSLLYTAVYIYYLVVLSISVAQSFGKESGFGVGLLFLAPVFYLMLGFGKSEFVGKKPMNDPIINSIFKDQQSTSTPTSEANVVNETPATENTTNEQSTNEEVKTEVEQPAHGNFCPSCGHANEQSSAYCEKCGNKLN